MKSSTVRGLLDHRRALIRAGIGQPFKCRRLLSIDLDLVLVPQRKDPVQNLPRSMHLSRQIPPRSNLDRLRDKLIQLLLLTVLDRNFAHRRPSCPRHGRSGPKRCDSCRIPNIAKQIGAFVILRRHRRRGPGRYSSEARRQHLFPKHPPSHEWSLLACSRRGCRSLSGSIRTRSRQRRIGRRRVSSCRGSAVWSEFVEPG